MASSSSSSLSSFSQNWEYDVFPSFHGKDVRQTFLSHVLKEFNRKGINFFFDNEIKRGEFIGPELKRAIRGSKIDVVLLSKNYASSSWCLDELVEIMKKASDQTVITIFYEVDLTDVKKQKGDFGKVFEKTCRGKGKEKVQTWRKALEGVATVAGYHSSNWDSESNMIEEIARDVAYKLVNSGDFEDMVGIEVHLQKMESLLDLDNKDEAMIVGIYGPAGIGKTTIARALHSRLSKSFRFTCFMEDIRGSYNSGLDEYDLKLQLQEQLLSKVLDHLGTMITEMEVLSDLKVLIILDDVDDIKQLEALADETTWFGPGSRIIVITKDQKLLRQHGIDNTYHVDLPSSQEALQILCLYAFRKRYPPNGFQELAKRVVKLCANLPLSLRLVGLSLDDKKEEDWAEVIRRVEPNMDHRDIEQVLRVLNEPSSSKKPKSKYRCFTGMAFFVVINLLLEIASTVADQLSSNQKPYFARISLAMSVLSVVLSILELTHKIRAHKARFRCKWPIPWFYYPSHGYKRIFGSCTDTVLLFCVVGGLVVSSINWSFIEKREDAPIKVSIWPLCFAIGRVGSKFMEKPVISKDHSV